MKNTDFGRYLRHRIKKRGWNFVDFAKEYKMSTTRLRDICKTEIDQLNMGTITKLANVLNETPQTFLNAYWDFKKMFSSSKQVSNFN